MAAGLMKRGKDVGWPSIVVLVLTFVTSRRIRGRSQILLKMEMLASRVTRSVAADE